MGELEMKLLYKEPIIVPSDKKPAHSYYTLGKTDMDIGYSEVYVDSILLRTAETLLGKNTTFHYKRRSLKYSDRIEQRKNMEPYIISETIKEIVATSLHELVHLYDGCLHPEDLMSSIPYTQRILRYFTKDKYNWERTQKANLLKKNLQTYTQEDFNKALSSVIEFE
ncbi:MAG: hypothetical protein M1433_01180 [Candidatus Parvarchaeota archaeon]|nr:hypothetical protein [Candidatus Parvarchaeota archaeon]